MIRLYDDKDKQELIALLKLNIPRYFDPAEEKDFIIYLDHKAEEYFVVEEKGRIIGAGGVNYFPGAKEARISWDIIHPDYQGKGIGTQLTLHRIEHIQKNPAVETVVVRTSQLAYRFYQKLGFQLERIEKDFWAKGFDLYYMRLMLDKD